MAYGRRPHGPIGRVTGVSRVDGADVVLRVRAMERISGLTPIEPRSPPQRSFAEVLGRYERGLSRSEPVPTPVRRPPPPPRRREEDDDGEPLLPPERLPETLIGLLWWKVKGRL